jgi:hypothetical protein
MLCEHAKKRISQVFSMLTNLNNIIAKRRQCNNCDDGGWGGVVGTVGFSCSVLWKMYLI